LVELLAWRVAPGAGLVGRRAWHDEPRERLDEERAKDDVRRAWLAQNRPVSVDFYISDEEFDRLLAIPG